MVYSHHGTVCCCSAVPPCCYESHKDDVELKKADTKDHVLDDSIFFKFRNRQNSLMVLVVRIPVTWDAMDEKQWVQRGFLGAGHVSHLDLGGGYIDVFTL